jgi:two-component system, NtrC family, response regulator HydG
MKVEALIVEDDANQLAALADVVQLEGFTVRTAANLEEARQRLAERSPDVILSDLMLPDGSGLELREHPTALDIEMVLITGQASVESAVQALRTGVLDYITKPPDLPRLRAVLGNVARMVSVKKEVGVLRNELRKFGRFGAMIGVSPAMQHVYDLIGRAAPTEVTVLVTGESGTGKELVAETIHQLSRRRMGPFLAVNCGAVSATLVESELFGHERGSFTGALQRHRGHFERAAGGTLFLDEVTEMPIELQVKLLRVLETHNVLRVGGSAPVEVDVRVIAATNRVPSEAVAEGKLREDLFYRLSVFPISLPPVRDRGEDLDLLTEHFLSQLAEEHGTLKRVDPEVMERFQRYGWPGNVRELKNVIERAYILADDMLDPSHIPTDVGVPEIELPEQSAAPPLKVGTSLADAERRLIMATLSHYAGDKRRAAETLGISLKTLYNRLNSYRGVA